MYLFEASLKLRADALLQRKLDSLPNVTVITSAQTTEEPGDGVAAGDATSVPCKQVVIAMGERSCVLRPPTA